MRQPPLPPLDPHAVWAQHQTGRAPAEGKDRRGPAPDMAMADPPFSTAPEDDLPRTFRRDRDARRAASSYGEARDAGLDMPSDEAGPPVTVRAFDVPFLHMVVFFLKAVIAAIPAMLLLTVLLYGFGRALEKFMPWLVKMKILISFQ